MNMIWLENLTISINFKILGIEHVAIAVNDFEKLSFFFDLLPGLSEYSEELVEKQNIITRIYNTGSGKIELLKENAKPSPISNFLNKREGIHHIAIRVDNLYNAINHLRNNEIEFTMKEPEIGADNMLIIFIHPSFTPGVLIELCQKIS